MKQVPFTQFHLPDGTPEQVFTEVPDELAPKVDAILQAGFTFACEVLTNGWCSFTIGDDHGDYANEICTNGLAVPIHVQKMIKNFDISAARLKSSQMGGV